MKVPNYVNPQDLLNKVYYDAMGFLYFEKENFTESNSEILMLEDGQFTHAVIVPKGLELGSQYYAAYFGGTCADVEYDNRKGVVIGIDWDDMTNERYRYARPIEPLD